MESLPLDENQRKIIGQNQTKHLARLLCGYAYYFNDLAKKKDQIGNFQHKTALYKKGKIR